MSLRCTSKHSYLLLPAGGAARLPSLLFLIEDDDVGLDKSTLSTDDLGVGMRGET